MKTLNKSRLQTHTESDFQVFFLYLSFQSDTILGPSNYKYAMQQTTSAARGQLNACCLALGKVLTQIWKWAEQLINKKYSLG